MKKLFLFLIGLTFFYSCTQDEVDFELNKQSEIVEKIVNVDIYDIEVEDPVVINTDYLTEKWGRQLSNDGISVELFNFQIIESKDDKKNAVYFLKAENKEGTVEIGAFLAKVSDTDTFSEIPNGSYIMKSKTCSCKGCPDGCHLLVTAGSCYCTSCPSWGPQQCEKTETIVINNE